MLLIQLTVKDVPISAAIETQIQKRAKKLKQFFNRICSCRVVIELPQKHKHQGKLFNVRIDVTVPGKEFVVNKKRNQDLYVAIRDAFNAVERRLEEHARKRHGRVKTHENVLHGRIMRIVPNDGFGFIEGMDGNEYYFSLTGVTYPTFNQLLIGDQVAYCSEAFNDGQQAHHIILERRQLKEAA